MSAKTPAQLSAEQKLANTRTKYEVRSDALEFAIATNSDNRSKDHFAMIEAAIEYEKFLLEANTGE